jgi:hypothetical protein
MPEFAEKVSAGPRANGRISSVVTVFFIPVFFLFPRNRTRIALIAPIGGRDADDSRSNRTSVNSATRWAELREREPRSRHQFDSAADQA